MVAITGPCRPRCWFVLAATTYEETGTSPLLGVTTAELSAGIDWPS